MQREEREEKVMNIYMQLHRAFMLHFLFINEMHLNSLNEINLIYDEMCSLKLNLD